MSDGPRSFPPMFTMAQAREVARLSRRAGYTRIYQQCRCCGLAVDPRNRARHLKACIRRKRETPQLWQEWWCDMHEIPENDRRRPSVDLTIDQANHALVRERIAARRESR